VKKNDIPAWKVEQIGQELNQLAVGAILDRRGGEPDLEAVFDDTGQLIAAGPRLEANLKAAVIALGGDAQLVGHEA